MCPSPEASTPVSAVPWHCFCPPPSFVSSAVQLLALCCQAATLHTSPQSSRAPPHTVISCVAALSDWLEAQQLPSSSSTVLGNFALNCSPSCGLSLLLQQAPSVGPVLRATLGEMAVLAGQESNGLGPADWHQALWLSQVLAALDSSQQQDSGMSSQEGGADERAVAPHSFFSSWSQWDLLQPTALAARFQHSPPAVAVGLARLALVRAWWMDMSDVNGTDLCIMFHQIRSCRDREMTRVDEPFSSSPHSNPLNRCLTATAQPSGRKCAAGIPVLLPLRGIPLV